MANYFHDARRGGADPEPDVAMHGGGVPSGWMTASAMPGGYAGGIATDQGHVMPMLTDPTLPAAYAELIEKAPSEWGGRRRIRKLTGGLIKPKPGPEELRWRKSAVAVRRAYSRPMTVVFANPKPGAAKTTATLLAAATLGMFRGGFVAAMDAAETGGALARCAESDGRSISVPNLLNAADFFNGPDATATALSGYLRFQSAHFEVLAADETGATRFGAEQFVKAHRILQRFYRVVCVDTGNEMPGQSWYAAINAADLLVVCCTLNQEVGYAALSMLDYLASIGRQDLVQNAVTVLSSDAPRVNTKMQEVMSKHFGSRTRAVITVPHDSTVYSGDRIVYQHLAENTRRRWLHACAAIADGLAQVEGTPR